MSNRVYHIVNLSFIAVILGVIFYSLIFRSDHPIPALLTKITGLIPPSKGLSTSFSELVRGNFETAAIYNPHGLRVFSFFILQLFTRILISISLESEWIKSSRVVIIDSFYSITLFGICFAPLIEYTIQLFIKFF